MPWVLADVRPYRIIVGRDLKFHWQFTEPNHLADGAAAGHRPFVATGDPVRRDLSDELGAQPSPK